MNQDQYTEMVRALNEYDSRGIISGGIIFVFGHCEASLTVIDEILSRGYKVAGILDNSLEKHGIVYKNIKVIAPDTVIKTEYNLETTVVLLATRFYEQMNRQLRELGFVGKVIKLVDYNTFSEFSLTKDTIERKQERVEYGSSVIKELKKKFDDSFIVFCPFNALGDVYLCMSYLPEYLNRKEIQEFVICVPSKGCESVVALFGATNVMVLGQKDLDAAIQAAIYLQEKNVFIAHQDRPYVINLHKALHIKKISLENIYRIGIFGLDESTKAVEPTEWRDYEKLDDIRIGRAAILSPYAKSVTSIPMNIWESIIDVLSKKDYQIFTNIVGDEKALPGTIPISPLLCEMKSVVEMAGLFIGLRSGLCDVIRTAGCRKIALYPDYYYGDTKWKAIDMYELKEFENYVIEEDFSEAEVLDMLNF